ncbi:hypothetical protein [Oceanicoccus sagamiensis]|nr:hypothetical protein [Oceanicoccus sagamiensis]
MSLDLSASEKEKILRLEATVEQLSIQLAEKSLENKRLTAALKEAMESSRRGERVTLGCDLDLLAKNYAFYGHNSITSFLKKSGEKCTKTQLITISKSYSYMSPDARRLLEYYKSL